MNPTIAIMPEVALANGLDTEALYEVIDGQRKELPPMGASQTNVANILLEFLIPFARTQNLGRVRGEMLFNFAPINKQRRPDVARDRRHVARRKLADARPGFRRPAQPPHAAQHGSLAGRR